MKHRQPVGRRWLRGGFKRPEVPEVPERLDHVKLPRQFSAMTIAHSKLTAQGQISVPAEIRRKLGLGPGSVIEWEEKGSEIVIRRAGRYSSADIHAALFPSGIPTRKSAKELKEGIRQHIRKRHARS